MTGIDETDRKILHALQENAKLTTKELADKANLSPSPTFERQKRLEREGYIEKYVALVDPRKVGNGFLVFCNIRLKQQNRQCATDFVETVQGIEEVTECYNISGDYDYIMKVYVRSMAHYQDFVLNTLGAIESVGSFQSIFAIDRVKSSHIVPVVV